MDILKKYQNPWFLYEQEIPHSRLCDSSIGLSPAEKLSPEHLQLLRDAFTRAKHEQRTNEISRQKRRTRNQDDRKMEFEEFCEVIHLVMGPDADDAWTKRFFNEVDICCTGKVSWQQLCSYFLQEYSQRSRASVPAAAVQDKQRIRHCSHNQREPTVRIVPVFHPPSLRYVSVSKGGQVTVWNKHLNPTKTLREVAHTKRFRGWVTDAVYMTNARTVAISTDSRDIHFINVSTTNAFEDFHLYGFPCVPTAVCYWYDVQYPFEPSKLLVGDEMGVIHVLQFLSPTKHLFNSSNNKEKSLQRIYLHHLSDHGSTVSYHSVPSVHQDPINSSVTSVVCCSMAKKQNTYIWKIKEGVKCFDYNAPLQLIVTGGSDCAVRLWARYVTTHPVTALLGHRAAVIDVAIYQPVEQVFSYSSDAELRIWDITTHECLKIVRLHFPCIQDAQIPDMDYLAQLSLSVRPRVEELTDQLGDDRSKVSLSCALYNPTLQQVVTAAADSLVCVWDLETGMKKLHISNAHGEVALSCMTLDSSHRRLVTGAHNGTIKVWNLLNGLNLHKLEPLTNSMVTGLLFLRGDHIFAVGWSQCIVEYDLASSKDLHVKATKSWKSSGLHKADILALSHCPELDVIATATQKGEVIVWKLETQMPALTLYKDTSSIGGQPVDCLLFLQHRAGNRSLRFKGVLVSSQAGFVCFWSITGQTHYYGQFFAPEQPGERVLTLSSNQSENTLLVSGDTAGWLHIWDISHYGLSFEDQMLSERPPLLHCWRAHKGAVMIVEVLKMAERLYILSASVDGSACLWTLDGDHVGSFGQQVLWNLTDPSSFQAKRDTESSLTEEHRGKLPSSSPDSCDSGQTSQRALSAEEYLCGGFEKEHQRPQTTMHFNERYNKRGASWEDRRFLFNDNVGC
ncbi:hypothetical protein WMY93_011081 [Mugilogobius chulae]|uniref:Uncharacterized protein n=1 Tax=Mugilogobius chulae TaxID=88201 RepID=A0AAW0PCQ5_9GOBI